MKKSFLLLLVLTAYIHAFSQNGGIEAHIEAELERRDALNEKITETEIEDRIFSAPAVIHFYGTGGEDAVYYTWYIYRKSDTDNAIARYTDKNIYYTFEQSGEYIVVLEVADKDQNVDEAQYSFTITESFLDVPNYFSPGDSPGSNDEFRVAYKSIVKFRMAIVNRWGVKMYESTDPAKGWDGRYKGKYVNTGVYFYVIEAQGSDGVKYRKRGDINILRGR